MEPPAAPTSPSRTCPSCHRLLDEGAKFCQNCGASIPQFCNSCGADLKGGTVMCPACGAPVVTGVTAPPPGFTASGPAMGGYGWANLPRTQFGVPLANWWPRVGALLLDGLILLIPSIILSIILSPINTAAIPRLSSSVAWFLIGAAYFGFLNGLGRGQTVGNMALGIAVRDANTGDEIGIGRGLLRFLVRNLLYVALIIPGLLSDLWPLWDAQHQTLADKACNSVMVRVR